MIQRLLVLLGGLACLGYSAGLILFADRFPAPGTATEPRLVVLFVVLRPDAGAWRVDDFN